MTEHLLLITLGPVQDFIAQARRTRDLWYGSHLLSELSRAAARALVAWDARLVVPALDEGDPELEACQKPLRNGHPPLNIANKVLAVVPANRDPREVARRTRDTVLKFWRDDIADRVKRECAQLLADGVDDAWSEQIETLVEFTAAWAPLGDYAATRRSVEQVLAARKSLRDFAPWLHQQGRVAKSSLDGARQSVLRPAQQRDPILVQKYRIGDGEELDAVGLVKRAGGDPEQFIPIPNIALASWLKLAEQEAGRQLEALKAACRILSDRQPGLARVQRDLPSGRVFPFDASVLLQSRWRSVFEEQGLGDDHKAQQWGRQHVIPLLNMLSDPYPYVACLVADGDHMGRAIDRFDSLEAHRGFSRAVSGFSSRARRIVEEDHLGSLVYSGGDDVLTFLPLPEALDCANDLRVAFAEVMAEACSALPPADRPTFSVGIGVGHVMESMGDLVALGREAEYHAKHGSDHGPDRNALAIVVDKRSGGRLRWRSRWDDWGEGGPVVRLHEDCQLFDGRLSSRKVYEVKRMLGRLPRPHRVTESGWNSVLSLEVCRLLSRAYAGDVGVDPGALGLVLDESADYEWLYSEVTSWVTRMLVSRTFAEASPRLRQNRQEMRI